VHSQFREVLDLVEGSQVVAIELDVLSRHEEGIVLGVGWVDRELGGLYLADDMEWGIAEGDGYHQ